MNLTAREKDKLMLFTAAMLAEKRKNRGLKLNHPEVIAYISFAIIEGARDGKSVAELMNYGTTILNADDVMDGVASMIADIQVEATFPDGTKLVTVHNPIKPTSKTPKDTLIPGEILLDLSKEIEINLGKKRVQIKVANSGDRPIQIGSHYHFYETNNALKFDRDITKGFRLNIPAGTAVRFEPGQEREVELVEFGGTKSIYGFQAKIMGSV